MSKELKRLIVNELITSYEKDIKGFVVFSFKGMNAHQSDSLRRDLSEKDIKMKVVKNSLASITFKEIGIPALGQLLEGQSAIATSRDDPIDLAKVLAKWSGKISEFKILGGLMDGKLLSINDVKALATIPSKQVVLTQILFGINTPLIQIANLFNAVINKLYIILLSIEGKKRGADIK